MTLNYNRTGDERKELVYAIQGIIDIRAKYAGMPTQAYIIGPYTVSKTGELSWEEGTDAEMLIEELLERGFEPEAELPQGSKNDKVDSIGISMPRNLFTDTQLDNMRKLVAAKANLIKKAMGADELPILDEGETVSFPWWRGDIGPEEVHAFSTFICKLKETAGELKRVTSKETEPDNEKYAFRCFLLKLGFIGDTYKADRRALLKNFEGSSAFKSGHRNKVQPVATTDAETETSATEAGNSAQEGGEGK